MLSTEQVKYIKNRIASLKPTRGGKFFYNYLPFRKKIVLQNMRIVFGDVLTQDEIQKLAICFYSHIVKVFKEIILLRFMTREQIRKRTSVVGEQYLIDLIPNQIKGAFIITGHMGNWELAPIGGVLNFKNYINHFFFVRKLQSIKFLEKFLFKNFYKVGLGVIPKKNALSRMYEVLEKHQIVVMIMDQHAKGKDGIPVEFFGQKTNTIRSVAMIAQQTGVPVCPARCYRRDDGIHVLEFLAPLPWIPSENPKEEIYLNTRQYNQVLERFILDYPEQWLWMYKRWKEFYKKMPAVHET